MWRGILSNAFSQHLVPLFFLPLALLSYLLILDPVDLKSKGIDDYTQKSKNKLVGPKQSS